jgi:predicted ATPase/DNA-binding winged helix-turn-helix (wHTH) protein
VEVLAKAPRVFEAGTWEVDTVRRELRTRGVPVSIGSRAFDIVEKLVECSGELVTREALISHVWPGIYVEENTLQVHIAAIRRALGTDRAMLKTIPGRGYRLLGDWRVRSTEADQSVGQFDEQKSGGTPTNLPARAASLFGRSGALKLVRDLLTAYRIVNLTGPGGIGKTTLAIEVAWTLMPEFSDGAWFVGLAAVSDRGLVSSAVAAVLGLKLSGATISAEAVARAIGAKTALLVLDNCEHVIDSVAMLAETVVRDCPNVTVLTSSREILKVAGECIYRVPPLDVPSSDHAEVKLLLEHSAVELFVARTRALDTRFSFDADTLPAIASICRRLDGIPLAIEFAAARSVTLGLDQVTAGLSNRFELLLSGRRRAALPRHQTLRAALDWSYDLLSEQEQALLRRLAIFAGGFSLDAAAAVTANAVDAQVVMAHAVDNLVAKSLVVFDGSSTPNRWRLLETIRAYAFEKLIEIGDANDIASRHAAYFCELFANVDRGSFLSPTIEDINIYTREIDNVRAALDWCFSPSGDAAVGVKLTGACAPFYLHLSLMAECRGRCERALRLLNDQPAVDSQTEMRLEIVLGITLQATMAPAEYTKSVLQKALDAADLLDDPDAEARVLWALSGVYFYREEYEAARSAAVRLGGVARRLGSPAIILGADRLLGIASFAAGRLVEARERLEHVLRSPAPEEEKRPYVWHFSRSEDRALTRTALARTYLLQGFADEALKQARMSLDELAGRDRQLSFCRSLYQGMCRVALLRGDLVEAEKATADLIKKASELNAPFLMTVGRFFEGKLLRDRREFARSVAVLREAFEACRITGWRMSYQEFRAALAEALAGLGEIDEAIDVVNEAVGSGSKREFDQIWFLPELQRIKGELLLHRAASDAIASAEDCFFLALKLAREQGSLFWELRAASSLARLRLKQNLHPEARVLLAPVYERFTEGFTTMDLRAARSLLDELPQ